jgi:hypothetical protein
MKIPNNQFSQFASKENENFHKINSFFPWLIINRQCTAA